MPPVLHRFTGDECKVLAYTAGAQSGPNPNTGSYASAAGVTAIPCTVSEVKPMETQDGSQLTDVYVVVTVALGTVVTAQDRIQVTKRNHAELGTPVTYRILGDPRRGRTRLFLNCHRIVGTAQE